MRLLLLLVAISGAYAQGKLSNILENNPNLSSLKSILQRYPSFELAINNGTYGKNTFLAPSNGALMKFQSGNSTAPSEKDIELLLSYHLLNGSFPATKLNSPGGVLAESFLSAAQYNNLNRSGGNVVYASRYGSSGENTTASVLEVYSGEGESATVNTTDLTYDHGYVHIVDELLDLPQSCTSSLKTLGLSSLVTALNSAKLAETLDAKPAVTCFAPTQEAFADADHPETNLSSDSLKIALLRHTLTAALYTPDLKEGTSYPTLEGNQSISVERDGGFLYIKTAQGKARVLRGNVIVNNGVIHVIDKILPPDNSPENTTSESPTASGTGSSSPTASGTGSSSPSASSDSENSAASFTPSACLFTAMVAIALAIVEI